jgi:hypothetical protein
MISTLAGAGAQDHRPVAQIDGVGPLARPLAPPSGSGRDSCGSGHELPYLFGGSYHVNSTQPGDFCSEVRKIRAIRNAAKLAKYHALRSGCVVVTGFSSTPVRRLSWNLCTRWKKNTRSTQCRLVKHKVAGGSRLPSGIRSSNRRFRS